MTTSLRDLIAKLDGTEPLSRQSAEAISKAYWDDKIGRMLAGETVSQAADGHPIYNQSEEDFRAELKATNDDLPWQVDFVDRAFDDWLRTGMIPAPYFAWRIAVDLSKAKRKDEEADFLRAWCRHFGDRPGGRFEALLQRARKMGVA